MISPEGVSYIGGLLARAREFCLLSVPTINGYRRFNPKYTMSPTSADWRFEDRSAMIRAVGENDSAHVENRIGEPCANPYLAIAAQLSAGLEGLTAGTSVNGSVVLGTADRDSSHSGLPLSLGEALEAFRESGHAEELLGAPLKACLLKLKESEVARFGAWYAAARPTKDEVTEWEQREYFGVF